MTILPFRRPDDEPDEPALAPVVERAAGGPGPLRTRLERVPQLPSPARVRSTTSWWCTEGAKKLGILFVRAPYLLLLEWRPIGRGFARIVGGWSRWCAATELDAGLKTAELHNEKSALALNSKKEGRRRLSLAVAVVLLAAAWVAVVRWPGNFAAAVLVFVAVCDAVGRKAAPTKNNLPPPARAVLKEGVPLTQVTLAIIERARDRWGFEFGVARSMTYSPARREYELWVTSGEALTAEHMRDFERAIGAVDYAMRCLAPPDGTAGVRRLLIREGDPLAEVPPPPHIETGSRSIELALDMGVSMTDTPFDLILAKTHVKVVMGTGGGKTAWFLRTCINRVSACRDAVILGVDLTHGPELPLWRKVVQRTAFDPEEAESLLNDVLAEIARRAVILADFAADDDPSNDDITEWCSALGPYWVVFIDEFSTLADFDGKGGKLNLLGLAEQIVRVGRKHGVGLIMCAQRTGNDDFGSTTMSTQAATAIVGPCAPSDAVRIFGVERRDQGYTPHLLKPGVPGQRRDAGKVFVDSVLHHSPDIYSCYAPLSAGQVKALARQRIADGLPSLHGRPVAGEPLDAVEVPPMLADVEQAFADAGNPDRMSTVDLLASLRDAGHDLDERGLAEALRPVELRPQARWRPAPGANSIRGYNLVDVQAAMGRLG